MTTAATPDLIELQAAVAGRYSLERELGRGGMGIVFLARDLSLERPVAIKLLARHLAHEAAVRERFLREARTVAALSHPHIVPIHAVEERGDLLFFVMSFIEGESLRALVERRGPLPPVQVATMTRDIGWALGYAHGRGVVHRDVKPDNILVERHSGRLMLTDFGIAHRASEGTLSRDGELLGTLQYMSPEQASGAPVDGRSDLYSLALTALFALSGRDPVEGGSIPAVLTRVLTGPVVAVDEFAGAAGDDLRRALTACLAREAASRPESGETLARELDFRIGPVGTAPVLRSVISVARASTNLFAGTFVCSLPAWATAWQGQLSDLLVITIAIPFLVLAASTQAIYDRLRGAVREGFGFADVALAVRDAHGTLAEEAGVSAAHAQASINRAASFTTRAGIGFLHAVALLLIGLGTITLARADTTSEMLTGGYRIGLGAVALYFFRSLWRGLKQDPAEVRRVATAAVGRWDAARLLTAAPGRWLFHLAERAETRSPTARTAAQRGEPTTALSRLQAALALLPPDLRARHGDVVELGERLEARSVDLHRRRSAAQAALGALPTSSAEIDVFEVTRRRLEQRIEEVNSALDLLRLAVLRLGAGVAASEGITAEVERAKELSAAIDAELHGRDEVRRLGV
jgi:hypothetical protein